MVSRRRVSDAHVRQQPTTEAVIRPDCRPASRRGGQHCRHRRQPVGRRINRIPVESVFLGPTESCLGRWPVWAKTGRSSESLSRRGHGLKIPAAADIVID